jgi:acid stress chaperone HdeB
MLLGNAAISGHRLGVALDPLPLGDQAACFVSTGTSDHRKESLVERALFVISVIVLLAANSMARAQVTVDVAKITCDELLKYEIADPKQIAIWISGYYHGIHGSSILDTQEFRQDMNKVEEYCFKHPDELVMKAVDDILGRDLMRGR